MALLATGRREDGIRDYERAMQLATSAPQQPSSSSRLPLNCAKKHKHCPKCA